MNPSVRWTRWLLWGLAGLALGPRLLLALAHTSMEGDEFVYVRMAQDLVGAPPGGMPLAQPLLLPLVIAAGHYVFTDWEWAGRFPNVLAGCLLAPVLAGFGRAILGSWAPGLAAGLVVALYPLNLDLGSRVMTEPLYHLLLVLGCWQTWRALEAREADLNLQSALAGLALGVASLARREGRFTLLFLALALLVGVARRRGLRPALVASALLAGTGMAVLLASDLLVEQPRRAPRMTLSAARLLQTTRDLVLPLLVPVLLFLSAPRQAGDARRLLFFGALLAVLPVVAIFPDPGRKATALIPFLALLAAEGAWRWGERLGSRVVAAGLGLGVLAWFLLQGVSGPMMPHFVPPWTDRAEDRQAGEWLAARLRPGELVGAWDHAPPYYASATWWCPRPGEQATLDGLVQACRERGVRFLVVDRRSPCRSLPVAGALGQEPHDYPGLKLEAVFPLQLTRLNQVLSAPLTHRGLHPDERAVVYSLLGRGSRPVQGELTD